MTRDEFEEFAWDVLGAVAEVCGDCTRLQIMGNRKTVPIARARCVFIRLMRDLVMVNKKGDCVIAWDGVRPDGYRPISFPLLSKIFGHNHSTYVLLNGRAHANKENIWPLIEKAKTVLQYRRLGAVADAHAAVTKTDPASATA